jgi:hypothetical protein
MQTYMTFKTFKEVKKNYTIEKWFHMPWHFGVSGQYVCYLAGHLECFKSGDIYIVTERR